MAKDKISTEEKHKLVIDEWFVNGFNGAAAWRSVYPKSSTLSSAVDFNRLLMMPNIQAYKEKKHDDIKKAVEITHLELLEYLKTWAFADITETLLLSPQEVKELPIEVRRLISEYEHTKRIIQAGPNPIVEHKIKVKFVSKEKAVEMLSRHIGFYEIDNQQKAPKLLTESEIQSKLERLRLIQSGNE